MNSVTDCVVDLGKGLSDYGVRGLLAHLLPSEPTWLSERNRNGTYQRARRYERYYTASHNCP